jgi:demethylmenaquinone methyltransferase/2-methoxy-6-polyprenyl-1,4-benzoquinol methylase
MLRRARRDHPGLAFARGDALNLPFRDSAFDAVTMAFGLRNLAQPVGGLREMLRVLRPRGRAVVLEFVRPRPGVMGAAYGLYLRRLLPAVGGLVSGDPAAYRYLSETVDSYHSAEELAALATGSGWQEPELRLLTFGTVAIVAARKR